MKLVQACLCAENTLQRRFNRRGGAVKHVQACLSASKDGERRFHNCGSHVNLLQACLWAEVQEKFEKAVFSTVEVREDRASLFMCGKLPTTPF